MTRARATADAYFDAMKARDAERLIALFTSDATLNVPDGRALVGDAIRQWFVMLFERAAPSPAPTFYVADERAIAVEIETTLGDGSVRRTANFFQLDDTGRIARLTSYARS